MLPVVAAGHSKTISEAFFWVMLNIDDRLIKETLPAIKPNGLAVLMVISIHLNKESGTCFPSHKRLMDMTGLGSESVYNALKVLKKEGLLISSQSIDSKHKTFSRRTFQINTDYIGIFVSAKNAPALEVEPLTDFPDAVEPDAVEPDAANHETYLLNESKQLNELEQLNKVGESTPAPAESETLKAEEVKRMVVAPPAEAAAPTHTVTTIDPSEPGLKVVSPFTMPRRVETVDEAEEIIMEWAKGDGRESVRKWYADAARQCTAVDVAAMVAKFAGVYLTIGDEGKRQRMAQDPLQFFKYTFKSFLKTEKSFSAKVASGHVQQQHPAPSALPLSLQNKIGK